MTVEVSGKGNVTLKTMVYLLGFLSFCSYFRIYFCSYFSICHQLGHTGLCVMNGVFNTEVSDDLLVLQLALGPLGL